MLEVTETDDGVYRVELTQMHKDWIDAVSKTVHLSPEVVLSIWIGAGIAELGGLVGAVSECSGPPPKSLDRGIDVDDR